MSVRRVVVVYAFAAAVGLVLAVSGVSVALALGSAQLSKLLADAPHGLYSWQIRPAHIVYTGDGSGVLGGFDGTGAAHPGHLRWTSWSQREARGSGAVWIDDCTPDCARGKFTAHAVKLVAFRPVSGHFTRLTLTYSYQGKHQTDERGIGRFGGDWQYYIVSR